MDGAGAAEDGVRDHADHGVDKTTDDGRPMSGLAVLRALWASGDAGRAAALANGTLTSIKPPTMVAIRKLLTLQSGP